jgi:hypothetical protein
MHRRGWEFSLEDLGTHIRNGGRAFKRLVNAGVRGGALPLLGQSATRFVPAYRKKLARIVQQNVRLMEVITAIQRARIFLDGSKDPERLDIFRRYMNRPVKIIRLIRDGRGVASSYMKHYSVDMKAALAEVLKTNQVCDRVLSRIMPADQLTVRYEDLCHAPSEWLERIQRFAGLQAAPAGRRALSEMHILGNQMRLSAGQTIQLDEQWRQELTASELSMFEALAGATNRSWGYQ